MKIAILVLFTVVVLATASANECTTGAVKQVECNSCRCLNGVWACTKMGCLTKRDLKCKEGETKMADCNHCFCSGGQWACTEMACRKCSSSEKGCPKAAECSDGETKRKDCNSCFCSNGRWACTLKGCFRQRAIPARFEEVARNKRGTCKPGATYQKDCNTCTCTETGQEICTAKFCL